MHSFTGVTRGEGSHLYSFEVSWNPLGERIVWVATVRDEDGRLLGNPSGEVRTGGVTSARLVRDSVEARIARLRRP